MVHAGGQHAAAMGTDWQGGGRHQLIPAKLAALLMLLRAASVERDVLALLDCKIEMTEIRKWIMDRAWSVWAETHQ